MSCREELDLAGVVIDSLKFAAEEDCIAGKLALTRLTRLHDVLASREGWLDCELAGYREAGKAGAGGTKLGLHLRVRGRLGLHCQRCLTEVGFDCAIDSRLLLIPPDAEWPEEDLESDEFDAIPASRELSVMALVEDEVLLALPLVPRHATCQPPANTGAAEEESEPSPFAVLAGLKKH
ncbi:MAG: YceD family protein [Rhodocyclaceae bacterium]|nr:YceD family protein [Rhodocyclaceae bacterium]